MGVNPYGGVLCKRCGETGVNMLEKNDLGQWSCLHLSP